jgi:hypothetical protein
MKVVLIASSDWSNLGYILSECLKSVGVNSVMLKRKKHYFNYPKQGIIVSSMQEVVKYAHDADIIQFMHSVIPAWFKLGFARKHKKKLVVFHGGSKYRLNYEEINEIFNPVVDLTLIQTPDLLNFGAKNEKWVTPAVDTSLIKPVYDFNDKLIVGHYPSSPIVKNSESIDKVMKMMGKKYNNFEYKYSYKTVPWKNQLERVSYCDIYIENLTLHQQNVPVGVWGLTALEVAACGDIVITPFVHNDLYVEHYGEFGPCIANNENELINVLDNLLTMSRQDLLELKMKNRRWVETFHSYEAIGNRLKKIYEEIL